MMIKNEAARARYLREARPVSHGEAYYGPLLRRLGARLAHRERNGAWWWVIAIPLLIFVAWLAAFPG